MTTHRDRLTGVSPSHWRWLVAPVFFAAFGVVCVVFQAWVFTGWASDGNARAFPSGGYQIPHSRMVITRVTEVIVAVGCVLLIVMSWRLSRAAKSIPLVAALTAGYFLAWWTDPYSGAVHHTVGHNRYDLNVLTWGPYLPGWDGPTPQIMSFGEFAAYPFVMVWIIIALVTTTTLRRWRPQWTRARVAATTAIAVFVIDILLEVGYILLAGYIYPRALPHLTIFEGEWYQLPLSSPLSMVLCAVLPVVLLVLHTKPGREPWLLEGSANLPRRARPWIRLLAGVGFVNLCMLAFQTSMFLWAFASYPIDLPSWLDRP